MYNRTYGSTKNCKGCRFWSEMIAKSQGSAIVSMCINNNSSESGKYKYGGEKCDSWESGHYGAVDSPGESDEIIQMYDEEEE